MATYNGGLLAAFDDHLCGAGSYSVEWFQDPLGKGVTIESGMCSPVTAMTAYDGGLLVAYANAGCTANDSRIVWVAHPDQTLAGATEVRGASCAAVTAMAVYTPPAQPAPGGLLVALDNSAPCAAGGQSVEWYPKPLSGKRATVVSASGCSPLTALAGHHGGVLAAFNSIGCQGGQNGIQFLPRPDHGLGGTPVSELGTASVAALVPYAGGVLVAYTGLGGGTQADRPQSGVQWAADGLDIRNLQNVFQGGAAISALAAVDGGLMAALAVPGTAAMIFLPAPVAGPPAAPSNLSATALTPRRVRLHWQDNANGRASFHIEMRVGSAFQEVGAVSGTTSSWVKRGLTPHTRYVFRVRAENTAGASGYSNRAAVVMP
jgi:hypothetical protein